MRKIARRVFAVLAIMGVLLMAGLVGFALYKVYVLRQHIERIQLFAKENGIVLKQTENIINNKKTFEIKSNSDINLAIKVHEEFYNIENDDTLPFGIYFKNLLLYEKMYDCFLEKDKDAITLSAKIAGKYYLVEKGGRGYYEGKENEDGIRCVSFMQKKERHFEFNENGTRKRILVPTDTNRFVNEKSYMKKCIESALKRVMPETDMVKYNINVLLCSETEIDYTKFAQDDFLYLKEKLENAKNFGEAAILLFLFYLFVMLSFIIYSRKVSSAVFVGIAFFIFVYVTNGSVAEIFFLVAVVVILDAFLSSESIEKRFVAGIAYIVFVMILTVGFTDSERIENFFFRGIDFYLESASGFIKYIVSAINLLMCTMLLDSIRHAIRSLNINPFAELEKEIVHIELASSFLPCLSKIKEKLSRCIKNTDFFLPKYKISIREDLSENEYKIIKNGKVYTSKILPSAELSDVDIEILVGFVILAKHNWRC